MFMKSKPPNYELKLMYLWDARKHFLSNAFVCSWKTLIVIEKNLNVLSLVQPIVNSNRKVTADNWFSSNEVNELREKKRTYKVPASYQRNTALTLHSSIFAFARDIAIVSYVPKKSKSGIICDALDKKCVNYSVGRRTKQWPLTLWYAVINIAGVNASVIYYDENHQDSMQSGQFLVTLSQELVHQDLKWRSKMTNLPNELLVTLRKLDGKE
ncbi:hypothetical protein PR048_025708 [Dryococelus australis]|uniref:PiggyBac transposable element-derived protein domain-containing protein n=1 Tax=Dryococelus australis TaxID=614101 RepID=A0ABQ9GJB6_9NEOP|nr:hypothetical protein PR048_025708 [Dryococelus australis]